jgi:hypothetical protein
MRGGFWMQALLPFGEGNAVVHEPTDLAGHARPLQSNSSAGPISQTCRIIFQPIEL